MAEPAQTLDCDQPTRWDAHVAHRIEDTYASTEQERVLGSVDLVGNSDGSFATDDAIFAIYRSVSLILFRWNDERVMMKRERGYTAAIS